MDDRRVDLLIEITGEMRNEIREARAEIQSLRLELAVKQGERSAYGTIGTWVNSVFLVLLAAWVGFKK